MLMWTKRDTVFRSNKNLYIRNAFDIENLQTYSHGRIYHYFPDQDIPSSFNIIGSKMILHRGERETESLQPV